MNALKNQLNLPKKALVTSALPYANGPIHIGHALEYVQTDIWVRARKANGHPTVYVCADDQHGTAIEIAARKRGISSEQMVAQTKLEHLRDFTGIGIEFDNYGDTHSDENRKLINEIYFASKESGHIVSRAEQQLYDEQMQMFIADRYVVGTCPKCGATEQYGDNCEVCGATYATKDVVNPISQLSGTAPVLRESDRYYFRLSTIQEKIKAWIETDGRTDIATRNKVLEWFTEGLKDWDISRDGPYFGFEIPELPNKYFYVWADAPVGYMASTEQWCKANKQSFSDIWRDDSGEPEYDIYHFIGKDIANFHCIYWPAMLSIAGFRTPTSIFVHGFLTVNGRKMSKRKGTFITLETYLEHLDPDYLRYYLAAKLTDIPEDIDLNLDDFVTRINADLVGKFVNIASRTAGFITKHYAGCLTADLRDPDRLLGHFRAAGEEIAEYYQQRHYSKAIRLIMDLADKANQFIADKSPWLIAREHGACEELHQVSSLALNLFRVLTIYLSPVTPKLAERVWAFFQTEPQTWEDAEVALANHKIQPYEKLMERIDTSQVERMVKASTIDDIDESPPVRSNNDPAVPSIAEPCTFDQFKAVDIRIARIVEAKSVDNSPKLTQLKVDLGDGGVKVTYASINSRYTRNDLIGRLTPVVANLPPKTFSFGVSEVMLMVATGNGDHEIFLLSPDQGARPGMRLQ